MMDSGGPAEPSETNEPARARASHRLIVKLEPGCYTSEDDLTREAHALAAGIPGATVERISHTGRVLLNLAEDTDAATIAADLGGREGIAYAEPDVLDRAVDDAED